MFPLNQKQLPKTTAELSAALTSSLRRAVNAPNDPVTVRENIFPDLAEIAVDLSGAEVRMDAPRPLLPTGSSEPAITAQHFVLRAHPIAVAGGALNLDIDADGIVLHQSSDHDGNLFLLLQRAENGRIAISIKQRDLETLIREVAKTEAAKQGVTIENVQLKLTDRGERSLGAEVHLQARKLFFTTKIRIAGLLDIDEQLVARVSKLTCDGDGAIGTLACGFLTPELQKLENRDFPLLALPLGEVQLRNIKLNVADGIAITAEFGAVG